ncbi:MAG TPA: alpha/beta fold hydrolase [Caldithrix abyssi]|uniref:Alpha/beta fold hydrolase n=1 Tax=Caldithrix abyssi TaxID=187145 RepID=A0A7V4WWD1_CALAY|nr:alpha/beta fold hydrolase [Caldithrix abyssi]
MSIKFVKMLGKKILKYALVISVSFIAAYTLFLAYNANRLPDLKPWHQRDLMDDTLTYPVYSDFSAYLRAEKNYLDKVYNEVVVPETKLFNRYAKNNPSSPYFNGQNLNASFQLEAQGQRFRGGMLLIHGLTDSPYHILSTAKLFAQNGYYVIGLRLPGHGTVPGALKHISWTDWYQAVKFAASYVLEEIEKRGGGDFYAGGFSTGGALILHYTLQGLLNNTHRVPDKLLFLSPAIGVMPAAKIANLHRLLSWIPGFEKLAWLDIQPEYDPFKYNSMPYNAGYQIYALTGENRELVENLHENPSLLAQMPDMFAFQSLVDATVISKELGLLFSKIASDNSRILLFGVNHHYDTIISEEIARFDVETISLENLKNKILFLSNEVSTPPTTFTQTDRAFIADYGSGQKTFLDTNWPENVFALSHVAIPIAPNDSVYGKESVLGGLNIKGEYDVLDSGINFMRLRYNPFWGTVEKYITDWFELQ